MEFNGNESSQPEHTSSRRTDPAWKYCLLKDTKKPTHVTCKFCDKTTTGGIFRAKEHLVGGSRNATACDKVPASVKEELTAYMQSQKSKKTPVLDRYMDLDLEQGGFGEDEDVDDIAHEISVPPKRSRQNLQIGGSNKSKSNVMMRRKREYDPIALDVIDECNEWLIGKVNDDDDLVFEGEDLTWSHVENAKGANEVRTTRQSTKARQQKNPSSSQPSISRSAQSQIHEEEEEEEIEDDCDDSLGGSSEEELDMCADEALDRLSDAEI